MGFNLAFKGLNNHDVIYIYIYIYIYIHTHTHDLKYAVDKTHFSKFRRKER